MKLTLVIIVALINSINADFWETVTPTSAVNTVTMKKVVCYTGILRDGKFEIDHLIPALKYCTHIVYGYAEINPSTYKVEPTHPAIDTGINCRCNSGLYMEILELKKIAPDVKILLRIGSNEYDVEGDEYSRMIVSKDARQKFVDSAKALVNKYNFDGLDLAWQFPTDKASSSSGSFWPKRYANSSENPPINNPSGEEYRNNFTDLIQDLHLQLQNKIFTLAVLPHVNVSAYCDPEHLAPYIDAIHLMAFDVKTPTRNPKEADYTAPIYQLFDRDSKDNIEAIVNYWLSNSMPSSKIILGIPTYGRTWKLTSADSKTGVPPLVADGPGAAGPQTGIPGLMSFAEICIRHKNSKVDNFQIISDPTKKYGSYGYKLYDPNTHNEGLWVSFEDPTTAENKVNYIKTNGLGGAAIWDLSTDDFRGDCTNVKFPIVKTVFSKLQN